MKENATNWWAFLYMLNNAWIKPYQQWVQVRINIDQQCSVNGLKPLFMLLTLIKTDQCNCCIQFEPCYEHILIMWIVHHGKTTCHGSWHGTLMFEQMRDLRIHWHTPLIEAKACALKCSLLASATHSTTTLAATRDQLVAGRWWLWLRCPHRLILSLSSSTPSQLVMAAQGLVAMPSPICVHPGRLLYWHAPPEQVM